MRCSKCESEIEKDSKFCSNCGTKVEDKFGPSNIDDLAKICSKVWYILGYVRAKGTKEELDKFEERIRKSDESMFEWYKEVVANWEEWAKENNEKNKKTDRSKRNRIQKTSRIEKK